MEKKKENNDDLHIFIYISIYDWSLFLDYHILFVCFVDKIISSCRFTEKRQKNRFEIGKSKNKN